MEYTTDDMLRDLMVPIGLVVLLAVLWTGISAVQAAMFGTSVWDCIISPTCGL